MGKRVRVILYLGWYLVVHILRRLRARIGGEVSGYKQFYEYFQKENIFELSGQERELHPLFGGCINCGLCVFQCEVLRDGKIEDYPGPPHLALCFSRLLPELWASKDIIEKCINPEACVSYCPMGVPLKEIINFIKGHI